MQMMNKGVVGMRWAKTSLRNSFFGWMAQQPAAEPSTRLEEIRKAMLHAIEQCADGTHSTVERKVLFAHDLDALWYLRTDLMSAIAASRGESTAHDCLADITGMFDAGTGGKLRHKRPLRPGKR